MPLIHKNIHIFIYIFGPFRYTIPLALISFEIAKQTAGTARKGIELHRYRPAGIEEFVFGE